MSIPPVDPQKELIRVYNKDQADSKFARKDQVDQNIAEQILDSNSITHQRITEIIQAEGAGLPSTVGVPDNYIPYSKGAAGYELRPLERGLDPSQLKGEWLPDTTYPVESIVTRGNQTYFAREDAIAGVDPLAGVSLAPLDRTNSGTNSGNSQYDEYMLTFIDVHQTFTFDGISARAQLSQVHEGGTIQGFAVTEWAEGYTIAGMPTLGGLVAAGPASADLSNFLPLAGPITLQGGHKYIVKITRSGGSGTAVSSGAVAPEFTVSDAGLFTITGALSSDSTDLVLTTAFQNNGRLGHFAFATAEDPWSKLSGLRATGLSTPTADTVPTTQAVANNTMRTVNHGSDANFARPAGSGAVYWIGSVEPTNMVDGDLWWDGS